MQITVEDVQLYFIDQGQGQPTLFLHGNPDSADMWLPVMEALAPMCRCLAIDLPGFGRSLAPPDFDCSLAHQSAFIEHFLMALGITEPINLVAHDFGAHYGLAWAVQHPEKVRKIAVMNTAFFSDYRWHGWAKVFRTPVVGELAMALTNEQTLVQSLQQAAPRLTREQIQRTYRLYTKSARRMALRMYRTRNPVDFRGWEDQLLALANHVPIYVLWGDQDPYAASRYAERFGAQQVDHFADYSHWLPLEAPAEVARRLGIFFAHDSPL